MPITLDEYRKAFPATANVPDETLANTLYQKYGESSGMEKPDFMLALQGRGQRMSPLESGIANLKSSFGTAKAGVAQALGADEAAGRYLKEAQDIEADVRARYQPEVRSYEDIDSPYKLGRYVYEKFGESAPQMGLQVAGALVGGGVGGLAARGVMGSLAARTAAALGREGAAVAGSTAAGFPAYTGANLQRQMEEGTEFKDVSLARAGAAAAAQSALDTLSLATVFKAIPAPSLAGKAGIFTQAVIRGVESGAAEALTETAQQALEIAQANPEKLFEFGPDVQKELKEAAVAGALLGGAMGGASGAIQGRGTTAQPAPTPAPAPAATTTTQTPAAGTAVTTTPPAGTIPTPVTGATTTPTPAPTAAPEPAPVMGPVMAPVSAAPEAIDALPNPPKVEFVNGMDKALYVLADPNTAPEVRDEATAYLKAQGITEDRILPLSEQLKERIDTDLELKTTSGDTSPLTVDFMRTEHSDTYNALPEVVKNQESLASQGFNPDQVTNMTAPQVQSNVALGPVPDEVKKTTNVVYFDRLNESKSAKAPKSIEGTAFRDRLNAQVPGFTNLIEGIAQRLFPGVQILIAPGTSGSYGHVQSAAILPTLSVKNPIQIRPISGTNGDFAIFVYEKDIAAAFKGNAATKTIHTMFHELSHPLVDHVLSNESPAVIEDIMKQYMDTRNSVAARRFAMYQVLARQGITEAQMKDPAFIKDIGQRFLNEFGISDAEFRAFLANRNKEAINLGPLKGTQNSLRYNRDFQEWAAEAGAAWMIKEVQGRVPQTVFEGFQKKMLDGLRTLYKALETALGIPHKDGAFEKALADAFGKRNAPQINRLARDMMIQDPRNTGKYTLGIVDRRGKTALEGDVTKAQEKEQGITDFIRKNVRIDNPATSRGATDWLQGKIDRAENAMRENDPSTSAGKGLVGSTTASSDVNIPLEMLQNVPGALDEKRVRGVQKYDELMRDVREKGWNPTAISIAINHLGQPYIYEGNTRVAIAKELGVSTIPARVNWMNGAENVEGDFKLENFAKGMLEASASGKMRDQGAAPRAKAPKVVPPTTAQGPIDVEAAENKLMAQPAAPVTAKSKIQQFVDFFRGGNIGDAVARKISDDVIDVRRLDERWAKALAAAGKKVQAAYDSRYAVAANESAYASVLDARKALAYVESMFNHGGVLTAKSIKGLDPVDKYLKIETTGDKAKGLMFLKDIIAAGKEREFGLYAAALRVPGMVARGLKTNISSAEAAAIVKKYESDKVITKAYEDYQNFNKNLMQLAVDSGFITPEMRDEFTKLNDYYPFYRHMDENKRYSGPVSSSGQVARAKIQAALGGTEALNANPLEVIMANAQFWVTQSAKNIASNKMLTMMHQLGEAKPISFSAKIQEGSAEAFTRINGKEQRYEVVNPDMAEMIQTHMNQQPIPESLKKLGSFTSFYRELVTRGPVFIVKNLIRDSFSTMVTSGVNTNPFAPLKNFSDTLFSSKKSAELVAMQNFGLMGGYKLLPGMNNAADMLRSGVQIKGGVHVVPNSNVLMGVIKKAWDGLDKAAEASDVATRMEVYKTVLAETGNEADAAFRAQEIMNFRKRGNSDVLRIASILVPFLNGRIQGLDVAARAFSSQNLPYTVAKGSILMGAALAMQGMIFSDDEVRDEYLQQPDYVRQASFLIPLKFLGLADKGFLAIPKPFEMGMIFQTVPEMMFQAFEGVKEDRSVAKTLYDYTANTLGFTPIPVAVAPMMELLANRSNLTGQQIVTEAMKNLPPELQYTSGTSEVSKTLAAGFGTVIDKDLPILGTLTSPVKIETLLRGYGGQIGTTVLGMVDGMYKAASGQGVEKDITQYAPIADFIKTEKNSNSQGVADIYRLSAEIQGLTTAVNTYMANGMADHAVKLMQENEGLFSLKASITNLRTQLNTLSKQEKMITNNPNLTPAERTPMVDSIREARLQIGKVMPQLVQYTGK